MKEIFDLLPVLCIAILMNMVAGLYYNIGSKRLNFSWRVLCAGVVKAAIIASLFIGSAYCFEKTDLSNIGIAPNFLMTSAISLYVGKSIVSLSKILGIEINAHKL